MDEPRTQAQWKKPDASMFVWFRVYEMSGKADLWRQKGESKVFLGLEVKMRNNC